MQQLQRRPQARPAASAACAPRRGAAWHQRGRAARLQPLATASRDPPAPGAPAADSAAAGGQARPNPLLPALRPQVYLQFCQVANKQVITRSKGKNLGTVRNFWVDPRSGRVVSFDLDEKKSLTSTRIANIPLSSLRQIGDVVLVNDDEAASQQPYDDRYGFVALIGMGVRTRSGMYLGKVRAAGHACSARAAHERASAPRPRRRAPRPPPHAPPPAPRAGTRRDVQPRHRRHLAHRVRRVWPALPAAQLLRPLVLPLRPGGGHRRQRGHGVRRRAAAGQEGLGGCAAGRGPLRRVLPARCLLAGRRPALGGPRAACPAPGPSGALSSLALALAP